MYRLLLMGVLILALASCTATTPTPKPSPTAMTAPTATSLPTPTVTPAAIPTATPTPSPTATSTPIPTFTPRPTLQVLPSHAYATPSASSPDAISVLLVCGLFLQFNLDIEAASTSDAVRLALQDLQTGLTPLASTAETLLLLSVIDKALSDETITVEAVSLLAEVDTQCTEWLRSMSDLRGLK